MNRMTKGKRKMAKETDISVPVVGVDGKKTGTVTLPQDLFAAKINKSLMAQAVRVYLANQRAETASTKTRGEVEGSTRKIYRQKGTGRARHGAIRAPIFVGGGITFGPKPRDYRLDMPKKMKRAALASALTSKRRDVIVVDGFSRIKKTRMMAKALAAVGVSGSTLLVTASGDHRAARNIPSVDVMPVANLHAYAVLSHQNVVFMKEALAPLLEKKEPSFPLREERSASSQRRSDQAAQSRGNDHQRKRRVSQ